MKSEPMSHQLEWREFVDNHDPAFLANGCEQGTGKTWMLLDEAERAFIAGEIDAVLVVAPKGVHINWIRRELPQHLSVEARGEYYLSGANKRHAERIENLVTRPSEDLKVFAINIDAVNTQRGRQLAARFLRRHRCMMIVDESQRIKNPAAARTKHVNALGKLAARRRIASGTIVADNPLDVWGQYEFLRPGLLGTGSYRAFVAEYAELLPASSPIVQEATRNARRGSPQIIRRDAAGRPVYRNLDRLRSMLQPHTFRRTKAECLDLPEKVYTTHYYDLGPKLRRQYNALAEDARWERDNGKLDVFNALTLIGKLRQAAAGFIMVDGEPQKLVDDNPRIKALNEILQDAEGQVVIWASHRAEIHAIAAELKRQDISSVEYHGGVTSEVDRQAAVDKFQAGEVVVFLANPQAAGVGLTLTAADAVVYYSCDFSLDARVQSEDRAHRIGTTGAVRYIDIAAVNTIDERVAAALQAKRATALEIMDGE